MQIKPIRLQEYGVGIFNTISTKSGLKKAINKKLILVNDKVATTAIFINGGEEITLRGVLDNKKPSRLILDLEVIYEDEHLAVINKPAGLLVSGNTFKTVSNALPQNLTKSTEVDAITPKPIHRLDYPTTGLLLVGKTATSIVSLGKMFEDKEIYKKYLAVTIGAMPVEGIIDLPIDNKNAVSKYRVLKTTVSKRFHFLNLVELEPLTGRRHQLRKHLYSMGNPILGDRNYNLPGLLLKGKGLYLQANMLKFKHPVTGEMLQFELSIPKNFAKIFLNN
ncbi:RluA family pseudouridine synthase [Maribacter sp. CXY002]|uniref:RluA family pseudouridine synthase n=1 Tax=Maribacter luteocoastalis TaxID=3407671 RepID=UPI003B675EE4